MIVVRAGQSGFAREPCSVSEDGPNPLAAAQLYDRVVSDAETLVFELVSDGLASSAGSDRWTSLATLIRWASDQSLSVTDAAFHAE